MAGIGGTVLRPRADLTPPSCSVGVVDIGTTPARPVGRRKDHTGDNALTDHDYIGRRITLEPMSDHVYNPTTHTWEVVDRMRICRPVLTRQLVYPRTSHSVRIAF